MGDVPQSALRAPRMTAMQDSQIGCRAGVSPKRIGAATTQAKAAHRQLEGVREKAGLGKLGQVLGAGVCAPSSGASEVAWLAMHLGADVQSSTCGHGSIIALACVHAIFG